MPVYEMKCETCGRQEEVIAKVNEIVFCKGCKTEMKRIPVKTGFSLKGRWFKEGY